MGYQVGWRVVGADDRALDEDAFPQLFSQHEEAVAFVLEKLSAFPRLGYDRTRGFWGRACEDAPCETRFTIAQTVQAVG